MKKLVLGSMVAAMLLSAAGAAFAADIYKVQKAPAVMKMDGVLTEWAGAPVIPMTLPDGGAVKAQCMWDEKTLYFAFTVADDTQSNPNTGGNIWNGDNVQISIDPNDDKSEGSYAGDDYEFGFALTDDAGPDSWAWHTADGVEFDPAAQHFAIVHGATSTTYEIALAAAEIAPTVLKKGSVFGAEVLVNDDDGSGRSFIEWTGGIGSSKDPSQYNDFQLQ